MHQLDVPIHPPAPIEHAPALDLDGAKAPRSGARWPVGECAALEDPRYDGEDLTRVDGLDEILADVWRPGLAERRILLALRDHDDGEVGRELAHFLVRLEAALAGHLLIEQQQIERASPKQLYRVVGIRCRLDFVSFLAQEDAVRLEELCLVVHPQYRFRRRSHAGESTRRRCWDRRAR